MKIEAWAYLKEYDDEREEILAAVDRVFKSGRLILGESGASFEREFARYCGVHHAAGTDNGTNAITLALLAAGVKPGDEIVTVPNTAAPTVVAIENAGAHARFVDIDPQTYLMDAAQLDASIGDFTKAVLPVHLYGQCADMTAIGDVAAKRGIAVLEDCAQAHGATQNGAFAGSMSLAGAYSFYPTKVLGAYGDAGLVVTNDAAIDEKLRRLRYYGMEDRYFVMGRGFNARLDEVHAEILRVKLKRIETYIERRRTLAARYAERLGASGLTLPVEAPGNRHVYYLYVVRHPQRDAILEALRERGIALDVNYRWPIHTMPGFAHLRYREGEFPHAERAAAEIFSLPVYPSFGDDEQDALCEALLEVLDQLQTRTSGT